MSQKTSIHFVTVNNKKHKYKIRKINKDTSYFECNSASIGQPFLNKDIPELLLHLPEHIIEERRYRKENKEVIRFRVSQKEKDAIKIKARKKGYKTISAYLRDIALKA